MSLSTVEDSLSRMQPAASGIWRSGTGTEPEALQRRDGERRLVEKLAAAGQLKAGFLLWALQQDQTELFELGLARLLQIDHGRLVRLLYHSGPRPIALACRAAGIDQCVFATVYALSRKHRRLDSDLGPAERADVEAVFQSYSKSEAILRLQTC